MFASTTPFPHNTVLRKPSLYSPLSSSPAPPSFHTTLFYGNYASHLNPPTNFYPLSTQHCSTETGYTGGERWNTIYLSTQHCSTETLYFDRSLKFSCLFPHNTVLRKPPRCTARRPSLPSLLSTQHCSTETKEGSTIVQLAHHFPHNTVLRKPIKRALKEFADEHGAFHTTLFYGNADKKDYTTWGIYTFHTTLFYGNTEVSKMKIKDYTFHTTLFYGNPGLFPSVLSKD